MCETYAGYMQEVMESENPDKEVIHRRLEEHLRELNVKLPDSLVKSYPILRKNLCMKPKNMVHPYKIPLQLVWEWVEKKMRVFNSHYEKDKAAEQNVKDAKAAYI